MGMLLISYAVGEVLPMRDAAWISHVWGSRIGANEMRMGANGLRGEMLMGAKGMRVERRMMATCDFKPDRCVLATCRAGSPNPAAPVAGAME